MLRSSRKHFLTAPLSAGTPKGRHKQTPMEPLNRRFRNLSTDNIRGSAEIVIRPSSSSSLVNGVGSEAIYEDDTLAPVMPAIDAVQYLMEEECRNKILQEKLVRRKKQQNKHHDSTSRLATSSTQEEISSSQDIRLSGANVEVSNKQDLRPTCAARVEEPSISNVSRVIRKKSTSDVQGMDEEKAPVVINNPMSAITNYTPPEKQEEYEFIPKSAILDVYSNDPEVKRFLKQLPKIGAEYGFNEQDYKCYSCRRPIGLVFGSSRLCHFDGHHYCFECHLGEKSCIPARILCNWDFCKYPISKRNQHFLSLISTEPIFELKTVSPLLYKHCHELREIEELRCQAFFIRSYCFTCVQDSISFELTKLVWPREHLIKQIDSYSIDDLIQIKSGTLKHVLKNVITFGRQHVLSCMLCCQKGFICEICKSSQIIYPFDTESVHRCNGCQSIFHKTCFKSKTSCDPCPRCQRLKARRKEP